MDPKEPSPPLISEKVKLWLLVGVVCLPIIYTLISVAQTIDSGVICLASGRARCSFVPTQWYNPFVIIQLAGQLFIGCGLPAGFLFALWFTWNDKY